MTETKAGQRASEASVGLDEMLSARDRRAARQAAALRRFGVPLVSVSIVSPGPVKDTKLSRRALCVGQFEIDSMIAAESWPVLYGETFWQQTGPEALYCVQADASSLKRRLVELENGHPLGRLWDFDVISPAHGGLSRADLGYPARRCLICERPSHACGRSQRHPLVDLQNAITALVDGYAARASA